MDSWPDPRIAAARWWRDEQRLAEEHYLQKLREAIAASRRGRDDAELALIEAELARLDLRSLG